MSQVRYWRVRKLLFRAKNLKFPILVQYLIPAWLKLTPCMNNSMSLHCHWWKRLWCINGRCAVAVLWENSRGYTSVGNGLCHRIQFHRKPHSLHNTMQCPSTQWMTRINLLPLYASFNHRKHNRWLYRNSWLTVWMEPMKLDNQSLSPLCLHRILRYGNFTSPWDLMLWFYHCSENSPLSPGAYR